MALFGPPNVEKLRAKGDVPGLIKALAYGRPSHRSQDANVRCRAVLALEKTRDPRAVPALIAALNDGESVSLPDFGLTHINVLAARALGNLGDVRAVEPLLSLLRQPQKHDAKTDDARAYATEALGKIGDARAVECLIGSLKDGDWLVREKAADALGEIGDARAVEPLLRTVKEGAQRSEALSTTVYPIAATRALKRIGGVPLLLATVGRGDADLSEWSARELLELADAGATKALITALRDGPPNVRPYVARALGKVGDDRAVKPLLALLKDDSAFSSVAAALSQLGWKPGADENGAWYWAGLGNWDRCKSLGPLAVAPLIAALKGTPDKRLAAARVLEKIGDARAVQPLVNLLDDSEKEVRRSAILALQKTGDARAVGPLIARLSDNDKGIRADVCRALGQIGDVRALEPLITARLKNYEENVRTAAFSALEAILERTADPSHATKAPVEAVISSLKCGDADVRRCAAKALGRCHWTPHRDDDAAWYWVALEEWDRCAALGAVALDALVASLKHQTRAVREKSLQLLAEIGDARAIRPILDLVPVEVVYEDYHGHFRREDRKPVAAEDEVRRQLNALGELLRRHGDSVPIDVLNRVASLKDIPCIHRETWEGVDEKDSVEDTRTEVVDCSNVRQLAQDQLAERRQ